MQDENAESEDGPVGIVIDDFVATLEKLIENNESLKKRVKTLEETFKDELELIKQENESLQEHLLVLIQHTKTELKKEDVESKEPHKTHDKVRKEYPIDDDPSQNKDSQNNVINDSHESSKRYKFSSDRTATSITNSRSYKHVKCDVNRAVRSPARYQSFDDKSRSTHSNCARLKIEKSEERNNDRHRRLVEHLSKRSHGTVETSDRNGSRDSIQRSPDGKYLEKYSHAAERSHFENRAKKRTYAECGDQISRERHSRESSVVNKHDRRYYESKDRDVNCRKDGVRAPRYSCNSERFSHHHAENGHRVRNEHDNRKHTERSIKQKCESIILNDISTGKQRNEENMNAFLKHGNHVERIEPKNQAGEVEKRSYKVLEFDRDNKNDLKRTLEEFKMENKRPQTSEPNGSSQKNINCDVDEHKKIHNSKEIKRSAEVDLPLNTVTLWGIGDEMRPVIRTDEDLKKLHSTPLKFINNFPIFSYKLISPLPNTPDPLKERYKELENVKINPVPLLNENRTADEDEEEKTPKKEVENNNPGLDSLPAKKLVPDTNGGYSQERCVEILTVVGNDDVEHNVFKRKRRV